MRRRGSADHVTARIRRTRRLGVSLMGTSLLAGAVLTAVSPAAVAQEGPSKPETTTPVELEKTAYYSYPVNEAAPNTLTSEFPPGVVCIVRPEACPESLDPVGEGVEGAIGAVEENEPDSPQDAVPPGTLPVGVYGGAIRYESAIKFPTPDVGDEQVDSYTLVMSHEQPTYDSSSPAFRQAVLAALTCARDCDQDQFAKTLETSPLDQGVLGVEACPFTAPFSAGPSQAPPENDKGDYAQPVDCLYGDTGTVLEDGTWLFDLTFAVQAWQDGSLANEGIILRPVGVENLAYGDPDPSKNSQVTFAAAGEAAQSTSPAPEPVEPFEPGPGSSGDFTADGSASGGGFTSSPSGGISNEVFAPPVTAPADPGAPAPEVADGVVDGGGQDTTTVVPVAGVTDEGPGSAWWMWLLVPVFGGGAWVTAQSLTAEVALGTADRSGAMTRLIAQNQARPSAAPMVRV